MTFPTLKQIEDRCGIAMNEWPGKCSTIADAAAQLVEGAVYVYGHYSGPIHEKSIFPNAGFAQHGWARLPDGRVMDPTRWAFECAEPYLYVGPADEYDEGGNVLRTALIGSAPEFDPDEEVVNVTPEMLNGDAWNFLEDVLDLECWLGEDCYEPGDVTRRQLQWIANVDPRSMQGHANAIFALLGKLRMAEFIPFDNRTMVEREESL